MESAVPAPSPRQPTPRESARLALRGAIQLRALDLFEEKGFESVSVEEIAKATGISSRTFFRVFPTKEEAALYLGEPLLQEMVDVLGNLEATEFDALSAMREAVQPLVGWVYELPEVALQRFRVILSSPVLVAGSLERQTHWARALAPRLAQFIGANEKDRAFRAAVCVGGSLASFNVAIAEWTRLDGNTSLVGLVDAAFAELRR